MSELRVGRRYLVLVGAILFAVSGAMAEHEHGDQKVDSTADVEQAHNHGTHRDSHDRVTVLEEGDKSPTLDFFISRDSADGWNIQLLTTNFRFAPENVGGPFVPGEGHAHLYVAGEQIARIYGAWFHVGKLPHGLVDVTVTLNANDHSQLAVGDLILSVTKQVQCH